MTYRVARDSAESHCPSRAIASLASSKSGSRRRAGSTPIGPELVRSIFRMPQANSKGRSSTLPLLLCAICRKRPSLRTRADEFVMARIAGTTERIGLALECEDHEEHVLEVGYSVRLPRRDVGAH